MRRLAALSARRVRVSLGERSYDIIVGPGVRHQLESTLDQSVRKAAVVTQQSVPVDVEPGVDHERFLLEDGERAKTLRTVEELCRGFARFGLGRSDAVVALGGGVVTDVAGFSAAVYARGVRLVNVPTTILGQVDAAIGGKTGVNLPEGKNLVGQFWQPAAVLCDTETLDSLSRRERASGMGEVAKYLLTRVPGLPAVVEDGTDPLGLSMDELVYRCARLKAAVVEADEREAGTRALLNYGHTLAHALEAAALARGGELRHGEAVAVGLAFAARLARRLGRLGDHDVNGHEELLSGLGLSTVLPPGTRGDELVTLMRRDKKARGSLTLVLDGPCGLEVVRGVPEDAVRATLVEMGAFA
jgi:5-deoxy-5-amino-3-dehydroquinate synthase